MDNITHSLVGLVEAQLAIEWRGRKDAIAPPLAATARLTAVLANNFPDLDLFLRRLTPGKLGYLLQHRGYTHTLLFAVPQALVIIAALFALARWRGEVWSRANRLWLFGIAVIGVCLHLGCDALNSYGVHPFWPWDSTWRYGDTLFIVEPLLWLSLLTPLAWSVGSRATRVVLWAVFAIAIALSWAVPLVPTYAAATVTLWGLGLAAASYRLSPRGRTRLAAAGSVAVVLVFALSSMSARSLLARRFGAVFADAKVRDIVLSPLPANPFCWSAIVVESRPVTRQYALTRAMVAPYPRLVPSESCPQWSRATRASLRRIAAAGEPGVTWLGRFEAGIDDLERLGREHAAVSAFLRFARAPFFFAEGDDIVVGDLRFDGGAGSFATVRVTRALDETVPRVPSWAAPRGDLLSSPGRN